MSNLIEFPKEKIVREPVNSEGMEKLRKKGMKKYGDAVAQDLSALLLAELANYGIDTEGEDFLRDFVLLSGVLTASIYRSIEVEHPLHKFIEATVRIQEYDPDNPAGNNSTIPGIEHIDIIDEV